MLRNYTSRNRSVRKRILRQMIQFTLLILDYIFSLWSSSTFFRFKSCFRSSSIAIFFKEIVQFVCSLGFCRVQAMFVEVVIAQWWFRFFKEWKRNQISPLKKPSNSSPDFILKPTNICFFWVFSLFAQTNQEIGLSRERFFINSHEHGEMKNLRLPSRFESLIFRLCVRMLH